MPSSGKLFPEYLDKGSKKPAAVAFLQALLLVLGCNPAIIVDGEYGEETATGVKTLQCRLGIGADGNFGPQTREALRKRTELDVNALPWDIFMVKKEIGTNIGSESMANANN